MSYAKGTKTSIENTEAQIKTMLRRVGADAVAMFEERTRAVVAFHLDGRAIQFRLPLPSRDAPQFTMRRVNQHSAFSPNAPDAADRLWVQACRERWRALHLCIKAKLESVEQGIETFDEAFLAHIQMPDGETVGDKVITPMRGQLAGAPMVPLLPGPGNQ